MNYKTFLKYTLGAPFTIPYLAFCYGLEKGTKSIFMLRRSDNMVKNSGRSWLRLSLSVLGLLFGITLGTVYGLGLGQLVGNLIFPGSEIGVDFMGLLFELLGMYAGACVGLGAGALVSKLSVKSAYGAKYALTQLFQGYRAEKLPPVRYSNPSKYWVNPSERLTRDKKYKLKQQNDNQNPVSEEKTVSQQDLWKIFHILCHQKRTSKKELSFLARWVSPRLANARDREKLKRNREFNNAILDVQRLQLEECPPDAATQSASSTDSVTPAVSAEGRKFYKLQVGATFYKFSGASPGEDLNTMRRDTTMTPCIS